MLIMYFDPLHFNGSFSGAAFNVTFQLIWWCHQAQWNRTIVISALIFQRVSAIPLCATYYATFLALASTWNRVTPLTTLIYRSGWIFQLIWPVPLFMPLFPNHYDHGHVFYYASHQKALTFGIWTHRCLSSAFHHKVSWKCSLMCYLSKPLMIEPTWPGPLNAAFLVHFDATFFAVPSVLCLLS